MTIIPTDHSSWYSHFDTFSHSCFIIFLSFQLLANKVSEKKPSIYFGLFSPPLVFFFFLWYFDTFFSNTDQLTILDSVFFLSIYIYPLNFHPSLDNEREEKEREGKRMNEGNGSWTLQMMIREGRMQKVTRAWMCLNRCFLLSLESRFTAKDEKGGRRRKKQRK